MTEEYTMSPWLNSPRDEKKVFAFAGFYEDEQVKAKEMEKMKKDITKKIKTLGGAVLDSECWHDAITHVVSYAKTRKEGMSEKVMGAIAAGRWVVTQRYIEKSAKAGQFLSCPLTYSSCYKDAVIFSRKRYHDKGQAKGGIFSGMKVVAIMDDKMKRKAYMRILAAGGATILKQIQSPRQLYYSDIFSKGDNIIVFMDREQKKNNHLVKVRNKKNPSKLLKFLSYRYIFSRLKNYSETKEADFDPFHGLPVEGKRNLPTTLDGSNKRQRRNGNNMQDQEVVCLSDDDDNDRKGAEISAEDHANTTEDDSEDDEDLQALKRFFKKFKASSRMR